MAKKDFTTPLTLNGDYPNLDDRYTINGDPYTSVSAAQTALASKMNAYYIGLTVLVKESGWTEAKEYWVQPKGTTPETYGLVEKGAGTTDYNDLNNKPTIGDGTNTVLPIVGNVKVSASTATGENAGVTITPGQTAGEIQMQFTLPKGADGADGQDGQDGAPGHNPCLGRFSAVPNPMPNGQIGDYLYVDITTVDQNTQEETTTSTVYHYGSNGWDGGAVIDAEHPTLASGQNVTAVHIKDENGDDDPNAKGVLSAEAGNNLAQQITGKLDKGIGNNLINPTKLIFSKAITWSGVIFSVSDSNYCISDYIPVNGQDIISNATFVANNWAAYAVFNEQKVLIRSGQSSLQYTYEEGDAFVVFSWGNTTAIRMANYGTTLLTPEEYTDYEPFQELRTTLERQVQNLANDLDNKLDKIIGNNLIDPTKVVLNSILTTTGKILPGYSGYAVSGLIEVNGQDIIADSWGSGTSWPYCCVYDSQLGFIRYVTTQQYSYVEGDYYVRFLFRNITSINSTSLRANYGTTLADYQKYTEYEPIQYLQTQIDSVSKNVEGVYKSSNIIDVGKGYDFTDIQPAINSITDASANNRYLIRIHDDYTVTSVTQLWLSSNLSVHASDTSSLCGFIYTKDYVDLMGAGRRVKISVKLPPATSSDVQQVNCHCLFERGDVRISNIEFESAYTRYTMHEENSSGSISGVNSNRKKHFKNVIFRYIDGTLYNNALGIGTAPGEECVYENCIIETYSNGVIKNGIGNLHSHPNYAYPFVYKFINCVISSAINQPTSVYTDIKSGVRPTFIFEGCDFGRISQISSPATFGVSIDDKQRDWRNGGFYLEGCSNRGLLDKVVVPCLYLISSQNGSNVNVIDDTATNSNSAYKLLFGDAVVVYEGTSDDKGVYCGSEHVLNTNGNAWSLRARLGDCTTTNKTLTVAVDNVEQTITLDENYSVMSNDTDVISDINAKLTGCTVGLNFTYRQLHWSDNVLFVRNTGTETIKCASIVTNNGGINAVKLANSEDKAVGIAAERINPGASGLIIIRSQQYFQGSGVSAQAVVGTKYKTGDGGILVQDNTDAAQFVCINVGGIFAWL